MSAQHIVVELFDPPPAALYCPFTGSHIISADDPDELERRLDSVSAHLRFVLFYHHESYPKFWAADPETLADAQRLAQETVIRLWNTAADVGQATATASGDWYVTYLEQIQNVLPNSSFILRWKCWYGIPEHMAENAFNNPKIHINWDFDAGYGIAGCFDANNPPRSVRFRRVQTMWDAFLG